MNPLISIIMPAYNAELYIAHSIESVVQQTYNNWQLIIVNDGSSDTTEAIAKGYLKDTRIQLVNQENKRLGAARNAGIKIASGEWIAFLDSDDLWDSNKLQKQMSIASSSPDFELIYTNGYIFYGNDLENLHPYPTKEGRFSGEEMYKMEYKFNYIPILSAIVKKGLINKIGFQEENPLFHGCEDWDYWLRMAKTDVKFLGIQDKLFFYRKHSTNMSSNSTGMLLAQAMVFIKNYEKKRFSDFQMRRVFKPLIIPLLITLLKDNKLKEADVLLSESNNKVSLFLFKLSHLLFKVFKQHSISPIKLLYKVDTFLDVS